MHSDALFDGHVVAFCYLVSRVGDVRASEINQSENFPTVGERATKK
jgi:hypothetical protein